MNSQLLHRSTLLVAGLSLILAGCAGSRSSLKKGEGEVVIAEGFAPYEPDDLLKTKRASLTDAQRPAVEKVVGVFVTAKTLVEKAVAIENNIMSQTEGWVKTYEILKEGPVEGGLYRTKIKALRAANSALPPSPLASLL